jgi:hypothetical protein
MGEGIGHPIEATFLRFPRLIAFREPEKKLEDATTVAEVLAI